jgi:drug/metabolite transporter (DMT)-like permease
MRGRILAAFAVVYLVWGSTYLGIRIAVATLPPFLLSGTRFVVAGGLLYAWARARGAPAPARREWLAALWIGTLLVAGGNAVVGWAEQRVPSGLAALLVAGMPLWVALFQRVAPDGKPISASRLGGLVLGFLGLALLMFGRGGGMSGVPLLGMASLVFASASWALGSVLTRRIRLPRDGMLASATSMLVGGAVACGVGLAGGELATFDPARVSAASVAAWAYLVVFGSMLAFTCFTWLVSVVDPALVSTYAYVNPVVALLLGWWLAGEPLGPRILVATPVILLGLVLVLGPKSLPLPGRRARAEAAARTGKAA